MKTLRAAAALVILIGTGAAAAPANAQSAGFDPRVSGPRGDARMVPLNQGRPHRGGFPDRPGGSHGRWDRGWNGGRVDFEAGRERWRRACLRRGRCQNVGFFEPGYYGYGYGGITYDPLIAGGAYGYYTQETAGPTVEGGRARFDYDRGYPYEYYGGARPRLGMSEGRPERGPRECATEPTRDRHTGRELSVRVCRN